VNNQACNFCSGVTAATNVSTAFGVCFDATDDTTANTCLLANAQIATACPLMQSQGSGSSSGQNSTVVDPSSSGYQNNVAQQVGNLSSTSRFVIIVVMIINTSNSNSNSNNVTLVVSLNGNVEPQPTDLTQVCSVLTGALGQTVGPNLPLDRVVCNLTPQPGSNKKRQSSQSYNYVAQMSYPTSTTSPNVPSTNPSTPPTNPSTVNNTGSAIVPAFATILALFALFGF